MNEKLNSDRPRVLVSCSLDSPFSSEYLKSVLREQSDAALDAIRRAGLEPIFVEASAPEASPRVALDGMAGLVILGGGDAEPAFYGQTQEAETIYGVNLEADAYEIGLISEAYRRDVPVLGICRGMQLINVTRRGALIQELGSDTMHYRSADNSVMTEHLVRVLPQTHLARIYGERELPVRSGHHQAVAALGTGLQIAAIAPDGIIEAIEAGDASWAMGVQWHPECQEASIEHLDLLFADFSAACTRSSRKAA
ncbi:gamma-glutamyl-gamma-aminobutyrate hydrolase family protein [Sinorhizobium meliloti]|uniref:gamma-glutamyl-gamma-aminobutyrate hydrolase family protein n=1 Tax=Rhizobium meliloti TaxID=382 RepID=UPI00398D1181